MFALDRLSRMKKTLIPFIALCLAAPSAFLLVYPTYTWNESIGVTLLAMGALLAVVLLGLTGLSFYRRQSRAFAGLLACGFCVWQLLVIPGFMHAAKIRRDDQRPNHSGAADGEIPPVVHIARAVPGHRVAHRNRRQRNSSFPLSTETIGF